MRSFKSGSFFAVYLLGFTGLFQHTSANCNGGDSCCDNPPLDDEGKLWPCMAGEGDCDNDDHCSGSLKCGTDNCVGDTFDSTDDCCYDPNPTTTTQPPAPAPTTTKAPTPQVVIDCKAMADAEKIIRNTRLAYGCDLGEAKISLNTCLQISCLEEIQKKSAACAKGDDKINCDSLEKVAKAIAVVQAQSCS